MLHESQEELKELRSKNSPSAGLRRHLSHSLYPMVRCTSIPFCSSTSHSKCTFYYRRKRQEVMFLCRTSSSSHTHLSPSTPRGRSTKNVKRTPSPLLMNAFFISCNVVCDFSPASLSQECLAAEIEGTMRRELSVEEEITFQDQR